ncbi:MAG: inorganic pyrophosphatase [Candidatus Komeilibacteria bacterium CG_4_9_14_3_um_filter_37_5]|nr:MAG: inorganic pyrophosphatase [Candidatus Komeilibacteria bacterium CG_4_9_14_3_um_filter_37_5]
MLAKQFLGQEVNIIIDRPLGSRHPKHDTIYEVNYGYLPGVLAPDGEELDVYYLGSKIILGEATGIVRAIIHRLEDDDDKLVVMPHNTDMTDEEIEKAVLFQERCFKHEIIRSI